MTWVTAAEAQPITFVDAGELALQRFEFAVAALEQELVSRRSRGLPDALYVPGAELFAMWACRFCACTEFDPCPDGCGWIEDDLCSECAHLAGTEPDTEVVTAVEWA